MRSSYNHLISNKRVWNNCSTKNNQEIHTYIMTSIHTIFGKSGSGLTDLGLQSGHDHDNVWQLQLVIV